MTEYYKYYTIQPNIETIGLNLTIQPNLGVCGNTRYINGRTHMDLQVDNWVLVHYCLYNNAIKQTHTKGAKNARVNICTVYSLKMQQHK